MLWPMRDNGQTTVAIAGAGIGGMALALSLVAAGINDVEIFDSAPAIPELRVGINVLPQRYGQRIWHEPLGLAAGSAQRIGV